MPRILALVVSAICALAAVSAPARGDSYVITLDPAARSEPATGRVILFFVTRSDRQWIAVNPMDAPFFESPQPIASIAVKDFKPGDTITIDGLTPAFPDSLDKLGGKVRVQAVLDSDQTERSHEAGPGNVFSDIISVELSPKTDETINLTLNHRVDPPKPRQDLQNLRWVRFRSELLSKYYGRDIFHRAGVALPKGYNDPNWPRQQWPAIYVIPGYGGRDDDATEYLDMLASIGVEEIAPIGVYIVLDPEAPLGHHGFVDSANNGPRETALLTEFIPYLQSQFRLVPKAEARLVTGHSSGGWSSLWLQLNHPEVFGGCWSSSPDPIDFSAFQMTDLYAEANMFTGPDGAETPSYRRLASLYGDMTVTMTVRQENAMECAIDPTGRSGQQWDAWEAMFSPRDEATGLPKPMFDTRTGVIDKQVVQYWTKFDITRLVTGDWERFGPIVLNQVHLACGDEDSYYLNRAVERFAAAVQKLKPEHGQEGGGYVLIVPQANHNTITSKIFQRWNDEMRKHLQRHGLQDADAPKKK